MVASLTIGAAALLLCLFDPATSGVFPPCPFHALTGLYCPGCGSLRALHQLLHGQLWAALRCNPLMVSAAPFVAYGLLRHELAKHAWRLPVLPMPRRGAWLLLALIVAYAVARNVPITPLCWLAPMSGM
jgi:hypothetical protein